MRILDCEKKKGTYYKRKYKKNYCNISYGSADVQGKNKHLLWETGACFVVLSQ